MTQSKDSKWKWGRKNCFYLCNLDVGFSLGWFRITNKPTTQTSLVLLMSIMRHLFVFSMPVSSAISLLSSLLAAPCLEAPKNDNQSEVINDSLSPWHYEGQLTTLSLSVKLFGTALNTLDFSHGHTDTSSLLWKEPSPLGCVSNPSLLHFKLHCRGTHFLGCTGAKTISVHWTELSTLTAPQKAPERFLQPLWLM